MTASCPIIDWWGFVSIFLDRIITKLKTFLAGWGGDRGWSVSWTVGGGHSPHLAGISHLIISKVRREFVLFIEASKQIFEGWGHSLPFVGCVCVLGGGTQHSPVMYLLFGAAYWFRWQRGLLKFQVALAIYVQEGNVQCNNWCQIIDYLRVSIVQFKPNFKHALQNKHELK